jgi:hypothetical protein
MRAAELEDQVAGGTMSTRRKPAGKPRPELWETSRKCNHGPSKRDFFRASRRNEGEERKKTRGLWKLTLLMEIRKGRGFPQQLEKASQKTLGFFTVPTGPTTNNQLKSTYCSDIRAPVKEH